MPPTIVELEKNLRPWEVLDWPTEHLYYMYKSWGIYFSTKGKYSDAGKYFDKCLETHDQEPDAFYQRSRFKRTIGNANEAVSDSNRAIELLNGVPIPHIHLEACDALYDANRFEDNMLKLYNDQKNFGGTVLKTFDKRLIVVDANINECVGESLSPFILKNGKHFETVLELLKQEKHVEKRPQWKVLRDLKQCDVQSILEKESFNLSPLEIANKDRKRKIMCENYLKRAWIDYIFLYQLRKHPKFLLTQSQKSSPTLRHSIDKNFKRLQAFMKMLHARCPMYSKAYHKRGNASLDAKFKRDNLFRIQHQTRRNMISILRTVRMLRTAGEVKRLSRFVEEVMGDYVVLKTNRVMPWKFEFVNEVYNSLALSMAEQYTLPTFKISPHDKQALCRLLKISMEKQVDRMEFVFGDRSTYEETQPGMKPFKHFIARLEKRMLFAQSPIEKAYLLHEIGRTYLENMHFDEACSAAKKAIEEAIKCNSVIWMFLSTMIISKSHAVLQKFERQQDTLESAYYLAKKLKSPNLCTFIDLCRMLNKDYLVLRKQLRDEASRRFRSKMSLSLSGITSKVGSPYGSDHSNMSKKSDEDIQQASMNNVAV